MKKRKITTQALLLLLTACFGVSALQAAPDNVPPPTRPEYLFRGDKRAPDEVFSDGFDAISDVAGAINDHSLENGLVYFTTDALVTRKYAVWTYTVIPNDTFYDVVYSFKVVKSRYDYAVSKGIGGINYIKKVNSIRRDMEVAAEESEWISNGHVPASRVIRAQRLGPGGEVLETRENPNFINAPSEANITPYARTGHREPQLPSEPQLPGSCSIL